MRQAAPLLLFLFALLASAAPAAASPASPPFDQSLITDVVGVALGFMAPRTLEPASIPTLAVWGLHGLSAMDPRLMIERTDAGPHGTLSLSLGAAALLQREAPDVTDAAAWGDLVGQFAKAACDISEPVRRAGTQGFLQGFFDELFGHLDPYSRYVAPVMADAERLSRAGRAGVGMAVAAAGGGFVADRLQAGGPAALAGIRPGERVLAVDGRSTQRIDLAALTALLAGEDGTQATVTLRGRDDHVREVTLTRVRIPPETVVATRRADLLVLTISGFSRNTGVRLAQELIRGTAEARPYHGVVLDLRDNRGGVLQQAVAAAAMLQGSGVVAVTSGRDPQANHVFLANGRDLAGGLPVVALVDAGTASAAEILVAALADQRRAAVVGSATFGKGLVQTISPLPDGGELFVSWSRVLAPLGWPLQGLGVLPQICTSLGQDALDRQLGALAKGIQTMQPALERDRAARAPLSAAEVLGLRAACPAAMGGPADLDAARFLIETPAAYRAALFQGPVPAGGTGADGKAPEPKTELTKTGLTQTGLTAGAAMRN